MRFRVWDEAGKPVGGVTLDVRVFTMDGNSYTRTIDSKAADWVSLPVQEDRIIQVVASRQGWTRRSKHHPGASWTGFTPPRDFAFGAPAGAEAPRDGAFDFLSDFPEVQVAEVANASYVGYRYTADPTEVKVNLEFSEPFDEPTRDRLAKAVRLWPADDATGNAAAANLARNEAYDEGDGLVGEEVHDFSPESPTANAVGAISAMPGGGARATWDTGGRTLTFAVDHPIGAVDRTAAYQVGFVSDGALFADPAGNVLGTDQHGKRGQVAPKWKLLGNLFWKVPRNSGEYEPWGGSRDPWNRTHYSTFTFWVRPQRSVES